MNNIFKHLNLLNPFNLKLLGHTKILRITFSTICLLILCHSCQTTFPNEKGLKYEPPVKVGDKWADKQPELGTPDKQGKNLAVYSSKGFIIYTTDDGSKIKSIAFSWFKGGKHFSGEIYSVKLSDTYPKVVRLWGAPFEDGTGTEDYYIKKWKFKKFIAEIEFWNGPHFDEDFGGVVEAETVKKIQLTLQ